jgi:hypothetical protein
MFKTGFLLDTFEKIAAAIHNQTPVEVYQSGELVDYGGVLASQTIDSVRFIDGSHMLKAGHEFRIR